MNWYSIIKQAAYEQWQDQVEELSKQNPYPFTEWFGGSDRVYLPFQINTPEAQYQGDDKYVLSLLQDHGCTDIDYRGGYCNYQGRTFKIGKLLRRLQKEEIANIQQRAEAGEIYNLEREIRENNNFFNDLISGYESSSLRSNTSSNKFLVVISQNSHDLAKMSTDRNWTSCKELGVGGYYQDVFCEVSVGALIAYLIYENDEQIQNPLARIHIRRFENKNGQSVAVQEDSVYGNDIPGFAGIVKAWIKEKQGDVETGVYKRLGGEHSDTFSDELMVAPSTSEGIASWIQGTDPNAVYMTYKVNDDIAEEWNSFVEDSYLGENEEIENESKEFQGKEEAEQYLNDVKRFGERGEGIDYIRTQMEQLPDGEEEEGTDDWRVWTKINEESGEYEEPRFNLVEQEVNHTYYMKYQAIKQVIESPSDTYPPEIIQMVHDALFEEDSPSYVSGTLDVSKRNFVERFPDYMTKEDVSRVQVRDLIGSFDKLPPEQQAILKEELTQQALKILDNPEELMRFLPQRAHNDPGSLNTILPSTFDTHVTSPLGVVHKPIPEPIIQKLVQFAMNLDNVSIGGNLLSDAKGYLLREIAHVLDKTKSDTPTVQNFYEHLLSFWGANFRYYEFMPEGEKPSAINLNNLGIYIANLGENGRQFIPFMENKLQEERNSMKKLEQMKQESDRGGPKHPIPVRWETMESIIEKNIEKFLYVIDALQNGKPSGKYRFF